jgi:hypothetical protein
MKNLFVWIVLISTAALGVAVAQPNHENGYLAAAQDSHQRQVSYQS